MAKTIPIKQEITPENKCGFCTGAKCCTYITHQIDTPKKKSEFDYLLWQVSHEGITVFKDDDGWFLMINSPCAHLLPDGRCGIYDTRPKICREHSNDNCEFDGNLEDDFDLYFDSYEALLKYCKKRFKRWGKKKSKG